MLVVNKVDLYEGGSVRERVCVLEYYQHRACCRNEAVTVYDALVCV